MRKLNDEQFNQLMQKLDFITTLLSRNIVKDMKYEDQLLTLASCGLQPNEIAKILGKKPNTISVALYEARKKQERKKNKE